jgi:hypothetical protein
MHRVIVLLGLLTGIAVVQGPATLLHGQAPATIEGAWALNRTLSDVPREIGFNPVWATAPPDGSQGGGATGGGGGGGGGGRRGGRGGGGGGGVNRGPTGARPESYDDAQKRDALVTEARTPPARLTIVDTPSAITVSTDLGQSWTFHPDLREEQIQIDRASVPTTTSRDAKGVVIVFHASPTREVHYTFTRSATPPQLIVEIQFLEHGNGDKERLVYEPAGAGSSPAATTSSASTPPGAAGQPPAGAIDSRPGAELKGLNRIGVVVEDLGDQATACGLKKDAIESAVSKQLSDGGFTVRRNSDDDTYLYLLVLTANLSNGSCLSRYDAFLYTHATTKLSYHDRPVLVQVLLMHRGGMGSSAAAAHPATVGKGLETFVGLFIDQIRSAQ